MEDRRWRSLLNELSLDIEVFEKNTDPFVNTIEGEWPVFQYNKLIIELASNFIGECRRGVEELGRVPDSFSDLLLKLNILFKQNFSINFPNEEIPFPLKYRNIEIPEENKDNDPFIAIVKSRINAFELSITFLKTQLINQPQTLKNSRTRSKADIRDFKTISLTPAQLAEILKVGKRLKFFSNDTNQMDFIKIFSGKPSNSKINWTGTNYSLNRFFQGINGKIFDKINDGKWEVVSELFLVNGEKVNPDSLKKPGRGENDRIEDMNKLIDNFIDFVEFEA